MKYLFKIAALFAITILGIGIADATTYTLRTLSTGAAVGATDIYESRQGSDTSDVSVTAAQIKTFVSSSPTLVTPTLGVASATSLATSAASPLLLTNGQLVTVALTSQTVGGATLTIPNLAHVNDTVAMVTLAQTLANKTFTAPVLGAATATTINGVTIPSVTDTVATIAAAQAWTGVNTYGASSNIVSKTSTSSTDINPPFDNRILGNPVVKLVYGSCTVSAVNAGTCKPLAGVASRTISVINFDIVAAGSAATCTGVLLEDDNGTPVVVATLAAATLTSGAHNIPVIATLGVGFGAGSGLTAAKGVQIIVNGSNCTTTTAFEYAITYTVQ